MGAEEFPPPPPFACMHTCKIEEKGKRYEKKWRRRVVRKFPLHNVRGRRGR